MVIMRLPSSGERDGAGRAVCFSAYVAESIIKLAIWYVWSRA